jgi:hypothetical protein
MEIVNTNIGHYTIAGFSYLVLMFHVSVPLNIFRAPTFVCLKQYYKVSFLMLPTYLIYICIFFHFTNLSVFIM